MSAPSAGTGSAAIAVARTLLAPWWWLTAPRFYGLDTRVCEAVRDQVRAAVDASIAFLLSERERDPGRHLFARMTRRLRGVAAEPEIVLPPEPRVARAQPRESVVVRRASARVGG